MALLLSSRTDLAAQTADPPVPTPPPTAAPTTAAATTSTVDTLPPPTTSVAPPPGVPNTATTPAPSTTLPLPSDPTLGPVCGVPTAAASTPAVPATSVSSPAVPTSSAPPTAPSAPAVAGCRIVAYYGNPLSKGLGILGRLPRDEMLRSLRAQVSAWAAADPATTTRCAFELIAITVQARPGASGLYRAEMPPKLIDDTLALARANGCLLVLDVQVGWSSFPAEVPYLAPWLAQPDVHLALDPEWDMPPGVKPGATIGQSDSADINAAITFVSGLVRANGLPPKLVVVHRFRSFMVQRPEAIAPTPEIRLVVNMDGFGTPTEKVRSYAVAKLGMPTGLTGFKLFTLLDRPMLGPSSVLGLTPAPVFLNYQ